MTDPIWPFAAYIFARAGKKDAATLQDSKKAAEVSSAPIEKTPTAVPEEPSLPPPIVKLVKVADPIPVDQQRELFKWMLEEKRKVKPSDAKEKKQIDEDKAILKRFIRAEFIPNL